MKKSLGILVLAAISLLLSSPAAGQVKHEIGLNKSTTVVNTTLGLGPSEEASIWALEWTVPKDADIISLKNKFNDTEITQRTGKEITLKSSGPPRETDTVRIVYKVETNSENIYQNLSKSSVRLPGLGQKRTAGALTAENILSWRITRGFNAQNRDGTLKFEGSGPVNLRIKRGNGKQTENFVFFGPRPENTQAARDIAAGMTGLEPEFDRFPVATMPDPVYNTKVNRWSSGEYVGGKISLRSSVSEDVSKALLAHETVHGLNDRWMPWRETQSRYFDEGVAEFVEFLVKEQETNRPTPEVFGNKTRYDENKSDRKYSVVPPKGSNDRLWEYYQENRSFMREWTPFNSDAREFGYAYSQLVIMKHAMNNSLRSTYQDLGHDSEISDENAKWSYISQHMDLKPCERESKRKFEKCLERVNSHSYSVRYEDGDGDSPKVEKVNVSTDFNLTQTPGEGSPSRYGTPWSYLEQLFNSILSVLR